MPRQLRLLPPFLHGPPCPNISTGGHSCQPLLEWISVQDMEKSVDTIVEPVKVWEERAEAAAQL